LLSSGFAGRLGSRVVTSGGSEDKTLTGGVVDFSGVNSPMSNEASPLKPQHVLLILCRLIAVKRVDPRPRATPI